MQKRQLPESERLEQREEREAQGGLARAPVLPDGGDEPRTSATVRLLFILVSALVC